ncbi:MAG: PAS domain S-box protein, partial [Candidatus Thorarchaeota archaeon]
MIRRILIVEDETIVAQDIRDHLENIGYEVCGIVSSGNQAIKKTKKLRPDLVLMDIVLKGDMDGIEAAEHIRSTYDIPIVYLTAYSDDETLQRAITTYPYGYLLKPFEEKELQITLEMALYRHDIEKKVKEAEARYKALFDRSLYAVYVHDMEGNIIDANQTALDLLGYERDDLSSLNIFSLMVPQQKEKALEILNEIKNTGTQKESALFKLIKKNGSHVWVDVEASLIYKNEKPFGVQGIVRDITEKRRAEIQLKSLFEASKLINSTVHAQEVFKFISDSVKDLVGFDNFIIFLVSENNQTIIPVYASQDIRKKIEGLEISYGQGLVGHCIKSKESILLKNAHSDRRARKVEGLTESFTSQILIPLIIEDTCVGALHISRTTEGAYDQKDVEVLKPLSEIISSAIKNARLYDELKKFNRELEKRVKERSKRTEIILETRQQLQKEMSWEDGLVTIIEAMGKLGFDRVGIFLVNTLKKTLEYRYGEGTNLPEKGLSIPLQDTEYFGVQCVTDKRTIYVEDSHKAKGKQITGEGTHLLSEAHSFVWVPIIVQDEAFAALAASHLRDGRRITEEDLKDLEILAGMCAIFIDRTRSLIEPIAEKTLKTEFTHWIDPSETYIIEEKKPEKSFKIFVDLVIHGIPGFVVSRIYPDKLRRTHELVKTPVVWLSKSEVGKTIDPNDLPKLSFIIEDFTKKSEQS